MDEIGNHPDISGKKTHSGRGTLTDPAASS